MGKDNAAVKDKPESHVVVEEADGGVYPTTAAVTKENHVGNPAGQSKRRRRSKVAGKIQNGWRRPGAGNARRVEKYSGWRKQSGVSPRRRAGIRESQRRGIREARVHPAVPSQARPEVPREFM